MHGMIGKNRKGRKRKSGRRASASGRVIHPPVNYRATVGDQPHRNWLPATLREHERAESVLGCLYLLKRISDEMYESGRLFAVIVGSFRSAIGTPKGFNAGGRGYLCEPAGCRISPENCECEIRTVKFRDATSVLQGAGQKAYNITYQVAIHDMMPSAEQFGDLRAGLSALARGFGLTRSRGA